MKLPRNVYLTACASLLVAVCLFFLLFSGVFVGAIVGITAFAVNVDPNASFLSGEAVGVLMFLVGIAIVVFLWWYLRVRRKKNLD